MKKILLMLFILGFTANVAQAQSYGWVALNPASIPGTPDFSDLFFINDSTGWISSSSTNKVFKTTDGGATFTVQTTNLPCNSIWMLNANVGYAGGYSGFVYKTTNGGQNWNFHGAIASTLIDIVFPPQPADTGYACGFNGTIYSVSSSGVTAMTSGVISHMASISFPVTSNEGWVCGESIIRHFTGGAWVADQVNITGTWNAICFVNNQNGWAVGDRIIHTTNGNNWTEQTNPDTLGRAMLDVFFLNANEGWIVGNQGLILHTTNGGINWTVEANDLTSALLTGVQFTSSTNGYIVGNNKTLLKYTQLTGINHTEQTSAIHIYPNPTDGIIKLDIPGNQHLEYLGISDLTGRKVIQKNNLFTNEIDLQSLPDGFYSVQIVTDKQQYFGKIIKQ